jgi:hypothetical protein
VLSLAGSFFEGGARTVVASRWRLRDDEAERLFTSFYEHLRRGETMGAALRLARQRAVADGMSPATWAGIELLGDADLALAPAPPPRGHRPDAYVSTTWGPPRGSGRPAAAQGWTDLKVPTADRGEGNGSPER